MERRRNKPIEIDLLMHADECLRRRAEDLLRAREFQHKNEFNSRVKVMSSHSEENGLRTEDAGLNPENTLLSPEAAQNLVHQLQVHQVELEMQNEELRSAQVEIEKARSRYFELYDLAPISYCSVSESGLILETNLLAATLLGCDRGTLVNEPITRFILKADQDVYYLHRRSLKELQVSQSCELRMMNRTTGKSFWAHLVSTYENDNDDQSVLRMVISDINERKAAAEKVEQLDRKLKHYNAELTLAKVAAERANLAKSDFLSNMSHELRNPLSAILGFAQLLESGEPAPTANQKRSIDQILKAGWYLLDLINEILDLALIESGKLTVADESVLLTELMLDCQTLISQQAKRRGIKLDFSEFERGEGYDHLTVRADYTRLKQVIINLVSNAIKYNVASGRVMITTAAQRRNYIRICVEDTGIGLSPEQVEQLFQPFNRLGQEQHNSEGTGIGLVITKRLVELMGGKIGVESQLAKGSQFWIELELAASDSRFRPRAELE